MSNAQTMERVALGQELNIMQAEVHRQSLLSALLANPAGFCLDLSEVQQMDTAGVQLLLSLQSSLAERGQPLHIDAASATVHEVLQTYGLHKLLSN